MPNSQMILEDFLLPDAETINQLFMNDDLSLELTDSPPHHYVIEDDTEWESQTIDQTY